MILSAIECDDCGGFTPFDVIDENGPYCEDCGSPFEGLLVPTPPEPPKPPVTRNCSGCRVFLENIEHADDAGGGFGAGWCPKHAKCEENPPEDACDLCYARAEGNSEWVNELLAQFPAA